MFSDGHQDQPDEDFEILLLESINVPEAVHRPKNDFMTIPEDQEDDNSLNNRDSPISKQSQEVVKVGNVNPTPGPSDSSVNIIKKL